MHLNEEQLIDLAEGARLESAESHLASCERCRAALAGLRALMSAAKDVEVPEPSPLFWDHLSSRVRDGVANEPESPTWFSRAWGWRVLVPAAALAALVLAATIALRGPAQPGAGNPSSGVPAAIVAAPGFDMAALLENDPSLSLLADLAGELDWDAAAQAGLTTGAGSVDRVLQDMSADERLELRRILSDEMAKSKKLEVKS